MIFRTSSPDVAERVHVLVVMMILLWLVEVIMKLLVVLQRFLF